MSYSPAEDPAQQAELERYGRSSFGYLPLFNGLKGGGAWEARITSEAPVVHIDPETIDHSVLLFGSGVPAEFGLRSRTGQAQEVCSLDRPSIAASARLRLLGLCALALDPEASARALELAATHPAVAAPFAAQPSDLIFLLRVANHLDQTTVSDEVSRLLDQCLSSKSAAPDGSTSCRAAAQLGIADAAQLVLAAIEQPRLARPGSKTAKLVTRAAVELSEADDRFGSDPVDAPMQRLCRELDDPGLACHRRHRYTPALDGLIIRRAAAVLSKGVDRCPSLRQTFANESRLLEYRPGLSRAMHSFLLSFC